MISISIKITGRLSCTSRGLCHIYLHFKIRLPWLQRGTPWSGNTHPGSIRLVCFLCRPTLLTSFDMLTSVALAIFLKIKIMHRIPFRKLCADEGSLNVQVNYEKSHQPPLKLEKRFGLVCLYRPIRRLLRILLRTWGPWGGSSRFRILSGASGTSSMSDESGSRVRWISSTYRFCCQILTFEND